MGTRSHLVIRVDGETKVKKYNKWDGYPTGQGLGLVEELKKILPEPGKETDVEACKQLVYFREKVKKIKEFTQSEIDEINSKLTQETFKEYPQLDYDTNCAEMVRLIIEMPELKVFNDDYQYIESGMYTIDLDENTLEIYFHDHYKKYSLYNKDYLPTRKDLEEFEEICYGN